jgi:hypothetical protein
LNWIELNDIFLSGTFYSQLMRYSRTCGSYLDFRDRRLLPARTIMKPGFLQCFTVDTMTWWTVTNICAPFVVITILSLHHSWLITGFIARVIRRVPLVERKLFTPPEHDRHDIAEILLKVALSTINQSINNCVVVLRYILTLRASLSSD